MRGGHESVGGTEGDGCVVGRGRIFSRGKQGSCLGWVQGGGEVDADDGVVKGKGNEAMLMGLWAVPNHGRVPERVHCGLEAGIVNVNGVILGGRTARSLVLRPR